MHVLRSCQIWVGNFKLYFYFYYFYWKWKQFVSKLCSSCRQMNKVYQKYNFCITSLNVAGATIFWLFSIEKPEISLAVVVTPTLGCAGSEQVKCVDLQALPTLLGLRRKVNLIHTLMIMSICSHQQNCHWNKIFLLRSALQVWKHCSYYALLTHKLWLQ